MKSYRLAIVDDKPVACANKVNCHQCKRGADGRCMDNILLDWLESECIPEVDWEKVPVDTKILVSHGGEEWYRRYFKEYKDGKVIAFGYGATSWSDTYIECGYEYAKLAEPLEEKPKKSAMELFMERDGATVALKRMRIGDCPDTHGFVNTELYEDGECSGECIECWTSPQP